MPTPILMNTVMPITHDHDETKAKTEVPNIFIFWLSELGLHFSHPSQMLSSNYHHEELTNSRSGTVTYSSLKFQPVKPKINPQRNSSFTMILLLLSGDTEINPGPRPVKYPCQICHKPAKWSQECLQCDSCEGWYHISCMEMPTEIYKANANSSISWIGCKCGLPNINPSLFHTLSNIELSNSFSCLEDTAFSVEEIGSPVATSSPIDINSHHNTRNKRNLRNHCKLKTLVLNCNGLNEKVPELQTLIDRHEPDIIIGTESHLKNNILTSEITPPGFVTFSRDRPKVSKCGIFIMTKEDIIATECNIISSDSELLWIEIHIQGQKPLIIGVFYRPPKSPAVNLEHLEASLANIRKKFKNAIITVAGDFNLADIDWPNRSVKPYATESTKCATLLEICNEYFLDQMVTEPTRISGATKKILDLVLTSHPNFIERCKVSSGISDHEAVTFTMNLNPKFTKNTKESLYVWQS